MNEVGFGTGRYDPEFECEFAPTNNEFMKCSCGNMGYAVQFLNGYWLVLCFEIDGGCGHRSQRFPTETAAVNNWSVMRKQGRKS